MFGMIHILIKKLSIVYVVFVCLLVGCKTNTGPCEWQQYDALAKVVSIDSTNQNGQVLYQVGLKFNASSLQNEIQLLNNLQTVQLTKNVMKKNNISHGVQYKFIVNDLISGNCKSPVVSFQHELMQ